LAHFSGEIVLEAPTTSLALNNMPLLLMEILVVFSVQLPIIQKDPGKEPHLAGVYFSELFQKNNERKS
jgi:hypothetical protein